MPEIPWEGNLEFDDCFGRPCRLEHRRNDSRLHLFQDQHLVSRIGNTHALPVLELLIYQDRHTEKPEDRIGLENALIWSVVWHDKPRNLKPDPADLLDYESLSGLVQQAVLRIRDKLGAGIILPIHHGYRFLGKNIKENFTDPPTAPVPRPGIDQGNAFDPKWRIVTSSTLPLYKDADRVEDLLHPRYCAVPLVGQSGILDSLWKWLTSEGGESRVSFQVLAGDGGSGKTRIGYELLKLAEKREPRWRTGMVSGLKCSELLRDEAFLDECEGEDTLLIIDEASVCADVLESKVVQEPTLHQKGSRLRFLLIDRGANEGAGWFRGLKHTAEAEKRHLFSDVPVQTVPELGASEKMSFFESALDVLHKFTGEPKLAPNGETVGYLNRPQMRSPLAIFMAAMNSHEQRNLTPLFWPVEKLTAGIAAKERVRIRSIADKQHCSERFLAHMAAFVTLTRGLSRDELLIACVEESKQLSVRPTLSAIDLAILIETHVLPSDDPPFGAGPIIPQMVGAALIISVLEDTHAEPEATILRALRFKPKTTSYTLARFAHHWRSWVIEEAKCFPETTDIRRLRAEAAKNPALRPQLAYNLYARAGVMKRTGQRLDEAKSVLEEAFRLYRSLPSSDDLGPYFKGYCDLLVEQAVHLKEHNAHSEALPLINEAIALYRKAEAEQVMGPRHGRWTWFYELLDYRRAHLNTFDPELFFVGFATVLALRGTVQSELGQHEAAALSLNDAIQQYRFALQNPEWGVVHALARTLWAQARAYIALDEPAKALPFIREAAAYYFELARILPRQFVRDWLHLQRGTTHFTSVLAAKGVAVPHFPEPDLLDDLARVRSIAEGAEYETFVAYQEHGDFIEVAGQTVALRLAESDVPGRDIVEVFGGTPMKFGVSPTGAPVDVYGLLAEIEPPDQLCRPEEKPVGDGISRDGKLLKPWCRIWAEQIHDLLGDNKALCRELIGAAFNHCKAVVSQDRELFMPALADWLLHIVSLSEELGHRLDAFNYSMEAVEAHVSFLYFCREQPLKRRNSLRFADYTKNNLTLLESNLTLGLRLLNDQVQREPASPLLPNVVIVQITQASIACVMGNPQQALGLLFGAIADLEVLQAGQRTLNPTGWARLSEVIRRTSDALRKESEANPTDIAWLSFLAVRVRHAMGKIDGLLTAMTAAVCDYGDIDERAQFVPELEWMSAALREMISRAKQTATDPLANHFAQLARMMMTYGMIQEQLDRQEDACRAIEESANCWDQSRSDDLQAAARAVGTWITAATLFLNRDGPHERDSLNAAARLRRAWKILNSMSADELAASSELLQGHATICSGLGELFLETCTANKTVPDDEALQLFETLRPLENVGDTPSSAEGERFRDKNTIPITTHGPAQDRMKRGMVAFILR